MGIADDEVLLRLDQVSRCFGKVIAVSGVDIELRKGRILALIGENGAGKSTLCRCICGIIRPDSGRMELAGKPYAPRGRKEAERLSVRMVTQELNLIPSMTVAENIFFGRLPQRFGCINYKTLNRMAENVLAGIGIRDIPPNVQAGALHIGQRQMVEIAAALSGECRLLILDEPTAALTDREVAHLFEQLRLMRAAGTSIIYISHRMDEIRQITDTVTVLRDGAVVSDGLPPDTSINVMVRHMAGRDLSDIRPRQAHQKGKELLRVENLSSATAGISQINFTLSEKEILGVAGLMGSGRTETMRALFGADRRDGGSVHIRGATRAAIIRSPADAVRQGIALLPEDRKQQGLLQELSLRDNIMLNNLRKVSTGFGIVRHRQEVAAARGCIDRLAIRCSSPEQAVATLSGGNQQKALMARWLLRDSDILIFDEPTRGIDIAARFDIYQLLEQMADAGKGIVVVSSDMKELLTLCDRIIVVSAGRLAGNFAREEFSQDRIMKAALSGYASTSDEQEGNSK